MHKGELIPGNLLLRTGSITQGKRHTKYSFQAITQREGQTQLYADAQQDR